MRSSLRRLQFTEKITAVLPSSGEQFELWYPVPQDDRLQTVTELDVEIDLPHERRHDREHGNQVLHLRLLRPLPPIVTLTTRCVVQRAEAVEGGPCEVPGALLASGTVPGLLAAARASGLPARLVAGQRHRAQAMDDALRHRWAEVFVPGSGWIPADPECGADCGSLPLDHVARGRGGRVLLEPPQQGRRLESFGTAYAEVDGEQQPLHVDLRARFLERVGNVSRGASIGLDGFVQATAHLPSQPLLRGQLVRAPQRRGAVLLVAGSLRLVRLTAGGRRLELSTLRAPALVMASRLRHTVAEAVGDVVIRPLGEQVLLDALTRRPELAPATLQSQGDQLGAADERLQALAYGSVPARVAGCLLRLVDGTAAVQGMTHQELGDMVGAYRETVTKVLHRFEQEGRVRLSPRRIDLLDLVGLRLLAES